MKNMRNTMFPRLPERLQTWRRWGKPLVGLRFGKERRLKLKKIVILKRPVTNSLYNDHLEEYLKMLFPECAIEIREKPPVYNPDEEIPFPWFKKCVFLK